MTIDPMLPYVDDDCHLECRIVVLPSSSSCRVMLREVIVMMITEITANDHHYPDHFEQEKKPMPEWQ